MEPTVSIDDALGEAEVVALHSANGWSAVCHALFRRMDNGLFQAIPVASRSSDE